MAICSSNIGPQTRNYTSEFLKIKKTAIYIGREGGQDLKITFFDPNYNNIKTSNRFLSFRNSH